MTNGFDDDLVGRVLVVEDVLKRHGKDIEKNTTDIEKLWEDQKRVELCLTSLPQIQALLKETNADVKTLKECKLIEEGAAKMKTGTWNTYSPWIKDAVFFLLGVLGILIYDTVMHLNGVGK